MDNCCTSCPRNCKINRNNSIGFCGANNNIKVSAYGIFDFEEPVISFKKGSGVIFFSYCSLKCVYCQNYKISRDNLGEEISVQMLATIFKQLDNSADNINLVNPTHYVQQIIAALKIYKPHNPVIYNTHGYENVETIKMLKDYVDIYLTDFKYFSDKTAIKYSKVNDYFMVCNNATKLMINQKPNKFNKDGKMIQGVIIRHLILPNHILESKAILNHIKSHFSDVLVSLMSQYVPCGNLDKYPEINRKLTNNEYNEVLTFYNKLNLSGFIQDLSSASEEYTPNFTNKLTNISLK